MALMDLSEDDREVVRECVAAIAQGEFIGDFEFDRASEFRAAPCKLYCQAGQRSMTGTTTPVLGSP
jgi:hypothetical protein